MTIRDWENDMAFRYDSFGCGHGAAFFRVMRALDEPYEICSICGGCGECWGECTCQKQAMNSTMDPRDFPEIEDNVDAQAEYTVDRWVQIASALKTARKNVLTLFNITEDQLKQMEADVAAIVGPEGMVYGGWTE